MTEREKQIKALLEKARKIQGGFVHEDSDCDCFACQTVDIIDQILALLPEPCPTCGGSKEVRPKHIRSAHEALPYMIPCPKCQSQEPAEPESELRKELWEYDGRLELPTISIQDLLDLCAPPSSMPQESG